jgi:hypothetical protein
MPRKKNPCGRTAKTGKPYLVYESHDGSWQ